MKRIPEKEEAIKGEEAYEYMNDHKLKDIEWIYKPFIKEIVRQNIRGEYLEVGAGPGFLATMIVEQLPDVKITAIDISPQMAEKSREYIKKKNLEQKINYKVVDATDKEKMSQLHKYNLIYSSFSLHHWRNPTQIFSNLWNVADEKGTIMVYDFKRVWWLYYAPLKASDSETIRSSYMRSELKYILNNSEVDNFKIKTLFPGFFQVVIAHKNGQLN